MNIVSFFWSAIILLAIVLYGECNFAGVWEYFEWYSIIRIDPLFSTFSNFNFFFFLRSFRLVGRIKRKYTQTPTSIRNFWTNVELSYYRTPIESCVCGRWLCFVCQFWKKFSFVKNHWNMLVDKRALSKYLSESARHVCYWILLDPHSTSIVFWILRWSMFLFSLWIDNGLDFSFPFASFCSNVFHMLTGFTSNRP